MSNRASVLSGLSAIVGARNLLTAEADTAPHLREWRDLYVGRTLAVAKPCSTEEVAAVVRLCAQTGVAIVPQGGNTGLVGGQIPDVSGAQLVLSLSRLDAIRAVDPVSNAITAEAGVTLSAARAAADAVGRELPLSLASEGSCTIGGNLATNAGGVMALAHGVTRDLALGLEVVLPDGRVWNGLSNLRKDNTGYDLKHLFIGAEGTLGVITAATLKLAPRPAARVTAFCGVRDPRAALALLSRVDAEAPGRIVSFELIPRIGLDFVLRHAAGARDPLAAPQAWYVLLETASTRAEGLEEGIALTLERAIAAGEVEDATLAASLDQRRALWTLREALSEVQRFEGGSIKHDVSVPVAAVPDFITLADAAVAALIPGCRPVPFGHLGDGNVHYNVSQPVGADKQAFLARWHEVNEVVHAIVARMGGSISAEHGVGVLKRDLLARTKDPVALALMRAIKATLDPKGIMNPGKVL